MNKIFTPKRIRRIGSCLIMFGIIVVLSAIMVRHYYETKAQKIMNELEAHITAEQKRVELLMSGNEEDAKKIEEQEAAILEDEDGDINYSTTFILNIDRIGIKSIIADGVDKATLKYAIGHYPNTPQPGEDGNCCLAGHSSIIYNEIFNGLEENIKVGDEITIKGIGKNFTYKVTDYFVVEATETEVVNPESDKPMLTITTCTDRGKRRFIVKAELSQE